MALILKQHPYNYSFSKNDLLWRFHCSDPLTDGCAVQIKLLGYIINSMQPPLDFITKLAPSPDDGMVNFNLQDIVDSMIDFKYPGNAVINIAENIKRFRVSYRQITTADPNPDYIAIDRDYYITKGGIEIAKSDYNNYFLNYHIPNKPFATWMPENCFVGLTDNFYISLLFANDFAAADTDDRSLRIIAEWTDSSVDTLDIDFTPTSGLYLLYHLKAGAEALGINAIAAGRTLYRYKLQVVNKANPATTYSEAYTFYIDYRLFYKTKLFNYYNSLGGIDFVRILGDTEETYNRSFSEGESFIGYIPIGERPDTQYYQNQSSKFNSYKSDAGFRHTIKQATHLQELLVTNMIWELIGTAYKRIWLLNKSNRLIQNSDTKFNFPIEWRYAFTDQVFTPDIDFGMGMRIAEVLTCPASVTANGVDNGNGTWRLTCDAGISQAIGYIFEYKLAADTLWTAIPSAVNFVDIPVAELQDYNWRVKVKCDETLFSNYTDGNDFTSAVMPTSIVEIANNADESTNISSVTAFFTIGSGTYPIHVAESVSGTHTGYAFAISVGITGTPVDRILQLVKNGSVLDTITDIDMAGTYTFSAHTFIATDNILIALS